MGFDVDRYLARLGYEGSRQPSLAALADLQLAHLEHVPFENLDVFHRIGVRTGVDWSYDKIVERCRGGWCFELNGCFAELLRRLGFTVDLLSCRTFEPDTGGLSDDFDHLTLLVHLDEAACLVDVGWGDSALRPLPVETGEYDTRPRPTRIEANATTVCLNELVERDGAGSVWEPQYEASREPRQLAEFEARSTYLQSTPGLSWTTKPLVTRATSALGGRVTLHRDRIRLRGDDLSIRDEPVAPGDWDALLRRWFGMSRPAAT